MGTKNTGPDAGAPSVDECDELLQNFLTHTADWYFLHDPDGNILDVNAAVCRGLGYSRDELLALNVADIEQRFSLAELKKRWELLTPGRSYRFDAFHRCKNGTVVLVNGTSQRFDLATGVAIAALIHPVAAPVSPEAHPPDEQAWQQDRYHKLQRAQTLARLGTWEWDREADRMTWDDTLCAIFGRTLEDYPRTLDGFLKILHPDSRPVVDQALKKTFKEQAPFMATCRIVRPGGETRTVQANGYVAEVDKHGNVSAMYGIMQDITERARLEERIEQSEARFRMLVEQSPDCFYVHDLQGNILDVGPGTCEELGYTPEEMLRLNVQDIEQATGYQNLLEDWHAMVPGNHVIFAGINRRKDGSEFPVEVHSRRFELNGEPRILALVRDITGQQSLARLMEIILRSTARHSGGDFLQLLVRELAEILQLKMAFVAKVISPDLKRLRVVAMWEGGAYRGPFEYAVEGTPCENVFEDQLVVVPGDLQSRFPKDTWLREHGTQSYVAIAFYDIGGQPLGHFGIMHDAPLDTTEVIEAALRIFGCHAAAEIERMHLQGELLNRERQLEVLVAVNKRLNSELDPVQVMRALIHAGQQLTGAAAGAWGLLQDGQLVFSEYQRGEEITAINYRFGPGEGVPGHVLNTGQPYLSNDPMNDPIVIDDLCVELRFHNLANVPIVNKEGKMLGCFELHNKAGDGFGADDLNWLQALAADAAVALDNAQLMAKVRASQSQLEQRVAERTAELAVANQELEAFSYSVSHDLRAPLRAIEGFAQALLDEQAADLNETGKMYLSRIVRATGRMKNLTEALLKLARIARTPLARQTVDLSQLAAEVVEATRADCTDRPVDVEIQPDVRVSGDAQLLRVALTNLIENACKFSAKTESPRIRFASLRHGAETWYYVQDNGAGFDMDFAKHLFEPFQRMHSREEFEGLGIGLATVQRIVHRHGGRVWAEGQPGEGATFYFTLPD